MTYPDPYRRQWHTQPPANLPAPVHRHLPAPMSAPPVFVPVVPVPRKSAGAAVALELVLGLLGIFGVGNLYAGRTAAGVILMLSFWAMFWVNVGLIFLLIGFVTMPLTWVVYLVVGPLLAAQGVEQHNARAMMP